MYSMRCIFRCISLTIKCSTTETTARSPSWTVKRAFTGGLNFADEYINRKQRCGVWKDTGLMLKGPGVYPLTVTFLKMWDFVAGTTTPYTDYMPLGEYESADGYRAALLRFSAGRRSRGRKARI